MITIFPGETEQCEFILPFSASIVDKVVVTFRQEDDVMLEFTETNVTSIDDNTCKIVHNITQAETLQLQNMIIGRVQVNVITTYNDRIVSFPFTIQIGEQFHRKQITS